MFLDIVCWRLLLFVPRFVRVVGRFGLIAKISGWSDKWLVNNTIKQEQCNKKNIVPHRPIVWKPANAPRMKVKLLSSFGRVKTYMVVFSKEDEVLSGLTEFALKQDAKSAHFQGMGSAFSLELGWFDFERLMYQVIPVGIAEVTSLMGNITWSAGKPIVHAHATASLKGGSVTGGHLLKMIVGPTLEVIVTVEPTYLYKTYNEEFQAEMIDVEID